ncbi:MAG: NAD(P)/FAD-dependent oxidoreductase [Gemmatimonadota bacterium]
MPKAKTFEVAVVGGGPAGLSCGLWLGRYLHSTVVIDSGDPRNWETAHINGFLGLPKVKPAALRQRGRSECRRYGVKLVDGVVDTVDRTGDERFELVLRDGKQYEVGRLVLAIGMRDIWPDLPGLDRCYGLSAHHCPDCDGFDACGKRTIVVGHGRKAASLAFALMTWTQDIIILTNGKPCGMEKQHVDKLHHLNIPIIETPVRATHSVERHLRWLELEDGMQIDAEKLFFAVEHLPADDLGVQLGCERDEDGLILVDYARCTSVEYVWAAGDITPGSQLGITAAADGAVAAASIHRSLLPEERRL